ncbi:hypothetical protein [Amycolatopsis anabasis]|uniref:hypothetical protein n=1 Tax=Amycolatopsis anabasis TaxID=1840409 RepID=UPI00131E3CD8|nr:hypothetical protein [Amycolatopsis anabasis]
MRDHPWFGDEHLTLPLPAPQIRDVVRREIRDTGVPPRDALPAAPFVIPRCSYRELFHIANVLLDLLRRTVLHLGVSTEGRLAALGTTREDYPLFLDDLFLEERYAACMARPDVVVGATGPKFLEFNVSGAVGGPVEAHCLQRAWHFLEHRTHHSRLCYDDPFAARAWLFRAVCGELDLPPRLAWVGSTRDLYHTDSTRYFDLELDYLHRQGFVADHFEPEELATALDAGLPNGYSAGLRHFTIPEWRELGIDTAPVAQALKTGCLLLSPQTSALLANKKTLGLISEGQPWMSKAEQQVVDDYVPWTRVLGDRQVTREADTIELGPFTLEHQEHLVLKRGIGMKGLQVVLGRDCSPEQWSDHVHTAITAGDSVVQDYVEPGRCRLDISWSEDSRVQPEQVAPVLSPFLFGGRRGGLWARFFATGQTGVISREGYGAMENVVLTTA